MRSCIARSRGVAGHRRATTPLNAVSCRAPGGKASRQAAISNHREEHHRRQRGAPHWKERRAHVDKRHTAHCRIGARSAARQSARAWWGHAGPTCRSTSRKAKIIDGHYPPRRRRRQSAVNLAALLTAWPRPNTPACSAKLTEEAEASAGLALRRGPRISRQGARSRHQARRGRAEFDRSPKRRETIGYA